MLSIFIKIYRDLFDENYKAILHSFNLLFASQFSTVSTFFFARQFSTVSTCFYSSIVHANSPHLLLFINGPYLYVGLYSVPLVRPIPSQV